MDTDAGKNKGSGETLSGRQTAEAGGRQKAGAEGRSRAAGADGRSSKQKADGRRFRVISWIVFVYVSCAASEEKNDPRNNTKEHEILVRQLTTVNYQLSTDNSQLTTDY